MIEFSLQELSELESLEIYGGTSIQSLNDHCGGKGTHDTCVNEFCSHEECTHIGCTNTYCTHAKCISKFPVIHPCTVEGDCKPLS